MKPIKYKIILIASAILFGFSGNINASIERTERKSIFSENQFRDPFSNTNRPVRFGSENVPSASDGGITPGETGTTGQGEDVPLGDSTALLIGFGLLYGIFIVIKNKNELKKIIKL